MFSVGRNSKKTWPMKLFHALQASFYRYTLIKDPKTFRNELYKAWFPLGVFGRIYVASEGINAQLSVPEPAEEEFLNSFSNFKDIEGVFINRALTQGNKAFIKLDIRVREKIVADGLEGNVLERETPGDYLAPKEFHKKLEDNNSIVIDTRNDYECETGHFEKAYCPESETFSEVLPEIAQEFKDQKDKRCSSILHGGHSL